MRKILYKRLNHGSIYMNYCTESVSPADFEVLNYFCMVSYGSSSLSET